MGRGREVFTGDFVEDSCAGPDADAEHRAQGPFKRMGLHESFDLSRDHVALPAQGQELLGQFGQHDPGR